MFTKVKWVSIKHFRAIWHASREILFLWTCGFVPFLGLAYSLIVKTSFSKPVWIEHPTFYVHCKACIFYEIWNIDVCKTLMPPFPNICIIGLTFDLDLWPTDLNINRDRLLIKDYLPTKFGVSGAKPSGVISCTRLRDTDIPTDMCNAICPSFFEGGIKIYISRMEWGAN